MKHTTQRQGPSRFRAIFLVAALLAILVSAAGDTPPAQSPSRPVVVEVALKDMVEPLNADFVAGGIRHAGDIKAAAVLVTIDTPGGLESSMRDIVQAIIESRVPVIADVAPSGARAASAGFYILLSADVAVMAPGTHTGAAHPVIFGAPDLGKTMEAKMENDAAAYIRSLAERRGRNAKLAEEGVRQSSSFTEQEALQGKLIDAVDGTPAEIFQAFDGKTIKRFDGSSAVLNLKDPVLEPYNTTSWQEFLFYIVDPNVAFLLAALGVILLYVEFTHPGMVAPGVAGAISLVLALFAFHMLPVNVTGVVLILTALVLFVLEVKTPTHGVLLAGGIVAMVLGALMLINTPWPEARIHLSTALAVIIPMVTIGLILTRLALAARRAKAATGSAGMIDLVGIAQTDLEPDGKIWVHGEIWAARAKARVPKGARVRVRQVDGLTLEVEPEVHSV
jgi:membrane-bound serine protease (ClpP class)